MAPWQRSGQAFEPAQIRGYSDLALGVPFQLAACPSRRLWEEGDDDGVLQVERSRQGECMEATSVRRREALPAQVPRVPTVELRQNRAIPLGAHHRLAV